MNKKQRIKISSAYNSWEEMLFGVSQGSIKKFSYMLFLFGYTFMDKQKAEDKNCAKF